jgi:prophage DNA circulation protein
MDMLTAVEAKRIDRSNPELERVSAFQKIQEGMCGNVVAYTLDKSAAAFNAAAALVFTAPYAMRIIDVIVTACATETNGAVTVYKGTDAIGTAIACADDGAVTHLSAGVAVTNKARMVLAAGDVVNARVTAGTDATKVLGIVTVVCQRL